MESWATDSPELIKDLGARVSEAAGEKTCQIFPVQKSEYLKRECSNWNLKRCHEIIFN